LQSIKLVLKHLNHVSRATNVSSRSRLEILTSHLSLVSAGKANVSVSSWEVSVLVSSFYVSCPSLALYSCKCKLTAVYHTPTQAPASVQQELVSQTPPPAAVASCGSMSIINLRSKNIGNFDRQQRIRKIFRIGTVCYNWPMSAHASRAFSIEHCTDSEDLPRIQRHICQFVQIRLNSTKIDFGWGSAPDPTGGSYSDPPDFLVGTKGTYF